MSNKTVTQEIAEHTNALNAEVENWNNIGIHPVGVQHITGFMDQEMQALMEYLPTVIPDWNMDEFNLRCLKRKLAWLIEQRAIIEPQVKKQRLQNEITQGIHLPGLGGPSPNGTP